jgi:hypothetical protein
MARRRSPIGGRRYIACAAMSWITGCGIADNVVDAQLARALLRDVPRAEVNELLWVVRPPDCLTCAIPSRLFRTITADSVSMRRWGLHAVVLDHDTANVAAVVRQERMSDTRISTLVRARFASAKTPKLYLRCGDQIVRVWSGSIIAGITLDSVLAVLHEGDRSDTESGSPSTRRLKCESESQQSRRFSFSVPFS